MSIINKNGINYLLNNDRVFLSSKNINIFPCSRRGLYYNSTSAEYYDPEARLNTERTNRIGTAINGFTDSFIVNKEFIDNDTLVFVLAGYRIEAKNFVPSEVAEVLGIAPEKIYAHLSLRDDISLNVEGYFTEILYRQSTELNQKNYLDVTYEHKTKDENHKDITYKDDFFVGISFTKEPVEDVLGTVVLPSHDLLLFSKADVAWQLEQASLLPKIEHGTTKDSVKVCGDLTVLALKTDTITSDSTAGITVDNKLTVKGATAVNDTITAEKLVITDKDADGTEKGEIITPQVRVNRITSNEGSITVDNKKLIVNKSLEMLAKESATEPAVATIEKAIIGDLTVKTDTKLKGSTGKITALNGQITNNATIYDLDVGTNIDTATLTATGKITAKEVAAEKITQNGNTIPSIKIVPLDNAYQLQFTLEASKK